MASELAEIESKLNNSRENVEMMMLQFIAKEGDVGDVMLRYFELKRDYHAQMADRQVVSSSSSTYKQVAVDVHSSMQ